MPTGDLTNNLRKLQKEIKLIKFEDTVDLNGLSKGVPAAFLPIYHYTFTSFSPAVAEKIAEMDVELYGKSDLKFMEGLYRVLRDMFNYKPPITKDQFFSASFAERKVIMCAEILHLIYQKHRSLRPQKDVTLSSSKVRSVMDSSTRSACGTSVLKTKSTRPKSAEIQVVDRADAHSLAQPARKMGTEKHSSHRPTSAGQSARIPKPHSSRVEAGNGEARRGVKIQTEPVATHEVSSCYSPTSTAADVPKTPAIYKAASSAVQVVYLPRIATVSPMGSLDDSNLGPIEVVASSPAKPAEQGRVVELSPETDEITQLQAHTHTIHRSVELLTERLGKLEETTQCLNALIQPDKCQDMDTGKMMALTKDISNKMETVLAKLVLVENRVSMIENRLETDSVPNGLSTKPPCTHSPITEFGGKTSANVENGAYNYISPVAYASPIKHPTLGDPQIGTGQHVSEEGVEPPSHADTSGVGEPVVRKYGGDVRASTPNKADRASPLI